MSSLGVTLISFVQMLVSDGWIDTTATPNVKTKMSDPQIQKQSRIFEEDYQENLRWPIG